MSVSLREQIANTLFEYRAANLLNKEARDNIAADIEPLIGKCTTPTFSGEEECHKCGQEMSKHHILETCPTEQKEHCSCNIHYASSDRRRGTCRRCGKPIPAEKKECEHNFEKAGETSINGDYICKKCGIVKPEPKPKDRIEPLDVLKDITNENMGWGLTGSGVKKLGQIIQWINQHK